MGRWVGGSFSRVDRIGLFLTADGFVLDNVWLSTNFGCICNQLHEQQKNAS